MGPAALANASVTMGLWTCSLLALKSIRRETGRVEAPSERESLPEEPHLPANARASEQFTSRGRRVVRCARGEHVASRGRRRRR